MNGRAILGRAVIIPHSEVVAHGVGLAVADDHAENLATRHPRAHPGFHSWLGKCNLVARAVVVMHVRVVWQPSFVGAPTHFSRGHAFFVEPFNRPSVNELINALGCAGDLGVTLADVNHLRASQHRQRVVATLGQSPFDELGAVTSFFVLEQRRGNLAERALGEVAHQPGVGTVLEHGRRAIVIWPRFDKAANVLVPHVQGALQRRRVVHVVVRIPQFHAGVEVAHAMVAAPGENGGAVDVPRQIQDEVTGANTRGEKFVKIFLCNSPHFVVNACSDGFSNAMAIVDKVDNGDARWRELHVANQHWHGGLGH